MRIGVPKELINNENRVALTPGGAKTLVKEGHTVLVEKDAGLGSGFSNEDYLRAGARIVDNHGDVLRYAELVVKVKEPLAEEFEFMAEGQTLFTFLHLAAHKELTDMLVEKRITAIAYETVNNGKGRLPLLIPMSEVAGRMAMQIGAHFLQESEGGRGILLSGVPGVMPADVVIIGGGTVGFNAAKIAAGLGARVTIIDKDPLRLAYLDDVLGNNVNTLYSNPNNIEKMVARADLLIGAVLVPGATAPTLVTEEMVKTMKPGSVVIDIAVDQGGCIETIDRVTTHTDPVYMKHGVLHYAVANMPGAVPRTSTFALAGVTLPYIQQIAAKGARKALLDDECLRAGLNVCRGAIVNEQVASSLGYSWKPAEEVLASEECQPEKE